LIYVNTGHGSVRDIGPLPDGGMVAGAVKWIVVSFLSGMVGLLIGAASIPLVGFVFTPAWKTVQDIFMRAPRVEIAGGMRLRRLFGLSGRIPFIGAGRGQAVPDAALA